MAHSCCHKSNFSTSKTMFYKLRLTLQSPANHQGDVKCQAWLKASEALQQCTREQGCATSAAWESFTCCSGMAHSTLCPRQGMTRSDMVLSPWIPYSWQRGSGAKCDQEKAPFPMKTQKFSVYIGIPRVRKAFCFFPFDRILFLLHWHSLL